MFDILIIGFGNVGSALYLALESAGYKTAVFDPYCAVGDLPVPSLTLEEGLLANQVILAVPDDALAALAVQLSSINFNNKIVVHTSGWQPSEILRPLTGASIGSLHPVQTFAHSNLPADTWKGIVCTFEGTDPAATAMEKMVTSLGARMQRVTPQQKAALHCGAVFAANYQVALFQAAEKILGRFNLSKSLLQPLIAQVQQNYSAQPATSILSGPLKRGDTHTIKKHLQLLEQSGFDSEQTLYKQLAAYLVSNPEFDLPLPDELKKALGL